MMRNFSWQACLWCWYRVLVFIFFKRTTTLSRLQIAMEGTTSPIFYPIYLCIRRWMQCVHVCLFSNNFNFLAYKGCGTLVYSDGRTSKKSILHFLQRTSKTWIICWLTEIEILSSLSTINIFRSCSAFLYSIYLPNYIRR